MRLIILAIMAILALGSQPAITQPTGNGPDFEQIWQHRGDVANVMPSPMLTIVPIGTVKVHAIHQAFASKRAIEPDTATEAPRRHRFHHHQHYSSRHYHHHRHRGRHHENE